MASSNNNFISYWQNDPPFSLTLTISFEKQFIGLLKSSLCCNNGYESDILNDNREQVINFVKFLVSCTYISHDICDLQIINKTIEKLWIQM